MAEAAENQGTPTAPARTWLRRSATALLAAGPLLGVLLPAPPASAADASARTHAAAAGSGAQAATGRAGTGSRSAGITIGSLTPTTPRKGDTLTVSGTVSNDSRSAIADGRIGLRIGPGAASRSALDQTARRTDYVPGADGNAVRGKHATAKVGGMRPGERRTFTLKVPVSTLKMSSSGVYQLGVTLAGRTRQHTYDQILGIERTFLPWQSGSGDKKTELTYLWPLISSAHLTARTKSDEQQTPVFRNDDLAEELTPGGRLQQLVALGKDLPVTWVIDPDLLATVDAMASDYEVRTKNGGTVPGKNQKYAKQWLLDLQNAVQGEEVAALPFADPDVASLAHRGKNVPGALSNLGPSTARGSVAVHDILHTEASSDYAWPVEGAVDSSIVDVATSAGAHNVIARSDSFRDTALSYTPTSARPIGGGNTALVADSRLSRAFEGDLSRPGASSKAVQRFLGETEQITAQVPTKQRSVLVAPQRRPSAAQAQAMAKALNSLQKDGRWTEGGDLSAAAKAKPDPAANRRVPGSRQYPAALRRQELPTEAYRQAQSTNAMVENFKPILTRDYRVVSPFGNAIERGLSSSWRGDAKGAESYRADVRAYLLGLTKKVKLIQKSAITLSGRSATIPVTVQNNLVQGIDGLELRLKSSRRIGLDVGGPQPVRVDGGHSQSVKFPATAKANGRSFVEAQLYTKDGKPYGRPMVFQVNVTSITSTVLLVIAGGVLLVVLAGVRMYTTRKKKGATRPDPDAPAAPAQDPGTDPDGTGDSGGTDGPGGTDGTDAGPQDGTDGGAEDGTTTPSPGGDDTARGSGSVPGTGEKVDR